MVRDTCPDSGNLLLITQCWINLRQIILKRINNVNSIELHKKVENVFTKAGGFS